MLVDMPVAVEMYLSDLVNSLGTEFGFEQSIKIIKGLLIQNRCLFSMHKNSFGISPFLKVSEILTSLNMPDIFYAEVERELPNADIIHLGYERQSDKIIYKLYLEYSTNFRVASKNQQFSSDPQKVHLAFKWNPDDVTQVTRTHYFCQPNLTVSEITRRLEVMYDGKVSQTPCKVVIAILNDAARKIDSSDLMFMEVHEDNNSRLSFDLNLYDAELTISDVESLLIQASECFSIPVRQWSKLMKVIRSETLGHISGGIGRDGQEFLTVYFGVVGKTSTDMPKIISR